MTDDPRRWSFASREHGGGRWDGVDLRLVWEADGSSVVDDQGITDSDEAFDAWVRWWGRHHPGDELVPIAWYVASDAGTIFEGAPFRRPAMEWGDFLTFFTWPQEATTGDPINFLALPIDSGKSWFIEPATGFRPGQLQPDLHLPTLLTNARCHGRWSA